MMGDVFRLGHWTHIDPSMRLNCKVNDRKLVAVVLLLGYEKRNGTEPLDLVAAMRRLGWQPIKQRKAG